MAKRLETVSGSLFAGNPIMVSVTPNSDLSEVSLLKIKIKIGVKLMGADERVKEYIMSSPATAGVPVTLDISSALRSAADGFIPDENTKSMPYIAYAMSAWEEYFFNGEYIKGRPIGEDSVFSGRAILGKFSEMERFLWKENFKDVQQFSRKPKYGEVVGQDETIMIPIPFDLPYGKSTPIRFGQKSKALSMADKSGILQINYLDIYDPKNDYFQHTAEDYVERTLYVDAPSENRYQFLFVNGLGAMETVSAMCLPEETKKYTQSTQTMNTLESFNKFSRHFHRVTSTSRQLRMSTGWITEEWMDWWLNDFFTSPTVWIKIKGNFIPCVVKPDDETKIIKRSAYDSISLAFTVIPCVDF